MMVNIMLWLFFKYQEPEFATALRAESELLFFFLNLLKLFNYCLAVLLLFYDDQSFNHFF